MTQLDRPGIIVPPPLLYGGAFLIVFLLHRIWPLPILQLPNTLWAGIVVLCLGLALNLWGVYSMFKARTPINPYRPAAVLVSSGPFRYSRNPLYVGLNLIFLGLTLILDGLWGLLALVPILVIMHYGVILREERHLEQKFGESYRQYCARVRRYL